MTERQFAGVLCRFALALLLLLSAPFSTAAAQAIIIEPPLPPIPPEPGLPPPLPAPIHVDSTRVEVVVDGASIVVRITQVFRNDSAATVEGQVVFPVPMDAGVSDLLLRVDGAVLEGRLLPADEARAIYRRIVEQQRDPALLQYVGSGLLQTNVFPIPPGATREVQLRYEQVAGRDGDLYRLRVPLFTGRTHTKLDSIELAVELTNQPGLRTIYSPNFGTRIQRLGSTAASVTYRGPTARGEGMFDLFWGTSDSQVGVNLLSYYPVEESEGYFALLVAPDVEAGDEEVIARDVVLVLDTSGSMQGEKMTQAREAAAFLVQQLRAGDRFALVSFSTGVRRWSAELEPVTTESVADALAWIARLDAGGSTDINRALLEGMALLDDPESIERPAYLLFMTDGLPTQGETDVTRILDNAALNRPARQTLRLFAFGVGFDVNTLLLDELSRNMGGRSTYVLPTDRIDEAVSQFYRTISTPVLTGVTLQLEGAGVVDEVYPFPLPDLFAGEQLVVVGRYRNGGEVTVTLRGTVNGRPQEMTYRNLALRLRGGEPFVARLWATRKLGHLMEQVRRQGADPEVIDAIVALSLRYGIVTPYTAYLALEPDASPAGGAVVPVMPELGIGGAPGELDDAAQAYAAAEGARMAAMPASGPEAVGASMAQNQLQAAEAVATADLTQFLAGKAFVQQGWVSGPTGEAIPLWVDTAYVKTMPLQWVLFGSDAYFVLAEQPEMAEWLAAGTEVIIVLPDGSALRVTQQIPEGVTPMIPSSAPVATPVEREELPQVPGVAKPKNFWEWLWGLFFPSIP